MSGVAFFDLDLTILDCNSATLWVKRQVREGRMRRLDALKMGAMIGLYQLGRGSVDTAVNKAIRGLKGQREDEIRERTEIFWKEEISHRVRPGVHDVIEQHRADGDLLVLLTGSSTYLSQCALEKLGMDEILCTLFESHNGVFTGEGVLCYGPQKRVAAEAFLEPRDIGWDACSFYTDSYTDISVLEVVGQPVVVHPDPRLLRHARKTGWPVADWGTA
jgi:HAD superfamily hydrolase (TIGR01490 family)